MQIDRRVSQLGMSEQKLNGAKIGAGFEQVRCKAAALFRVPNYAE
jgi:hypothetical protein